MAPPDEKARMHLEPGGSVEVGGEVSNDGGMTKACESLRSAGMEDAGPCKCTTDANSETRGLRVLPRGCA